jgi:uncharacterized Zn-finger protein
MPVSVTLTPSSGANPWQHHHYISPSSAASFPQSQDRYICQTCNKAFSRPSSLRIHSHSHTGEKPFKCPHQGCGKAFSVRSNMKRHERGCHSFEGGALVWTLLSRDNSKRQNGRSVFYCINYNIFFSTSILFWYRCVAFATNTQSLFPYQAYFACHHGGRWRIISAASIYTGVMAVAPRDRSRRSEQEEDSVWYTGEFGGT